MKVAVVHDYLNQYGGAERVLEAILELYPQADLYTTLYEPNSFSKSSSLSRGSVTGERGSPLKAQRKSDWKGRVFSLTLPGIVGKWSKLFTLWYPLVFERYDFSGYDVVISSSANFAKGVITPPGTMHISYIHTPPRFLYGYSTESNWRSRPIIGKFFRPIDNYLRVWDFNAAQRIDKVIVNSINVAKRVGKFYHREATVVYPPVGLVDRIGEVSPGGNIELDIEDDRSNNTTRSGLGLTQRDEQPFCLVVSRLSRYKNVDLVIEAAALLPDLSVRIVGSGPERKNLESRIKSQGLEERVELLGFVNDSELIRLYRASDAVICPTEDEDFGIVPVEAMAAGTPVIALRSGGYQETVVEGKTGFFFDQPTAESLAQVIRSPGFDLQALDSLEVQRHAQKFSRERFLQEFAVVVDEVLG